MPPPSRISLDNPPPPARGNVRPADPAVPASAAMGGSITSATLPQALIERAMLAEQALTSLAQVDPRLTPLVATLVEQLRSGVQQQIQGGGQGVQQQQPGGAGLGDVLKSLASGGAPPPVA